MTERKGVLHVSDFTLRDDQFCARSVVRRFFGGEGRRAPTFVQFDGKFREEKWRRLFEKAGLLVDYQPVVSRGRLVGHPDFIIEINGTRRVVELTGHDSQVPDTVRWAREAQKRRQVRLYQLLTGYRDPAFVIVENKGNNEFAISRVEWDSSEVAALLRRVVVVDDAIASVEAGGGQQAIRNLGRCRKRKCEVCREFED